jgi:hypothetical protein
VLVICDKCDFIRNFARQAAFNTIDQANLGFLV